MEHTVNDVSRGWAGATVAALPGMDILRQAPLFAFDHETRKQIRETRMTLLEHLRSDPEDFKALVLADVIGELDPDRDLSIADHRMRFRATRDRDGDWRVRAKELGLDRVLYNLAHGMERANMGRDAAQILMRRAAEIGEARPIDVVRGHIDASYVPAALVPHTSFHASGHVARVAVHIEAMHEGELQLHPIPGSGSFRIVEKIGGYGTVNRELYKDGAIHATLNTPWHDGEESTHVKPWTRWVEESLSELARLVEAAPPARPRKPAKRRTRR